MPDFTGLKVPDSTPVSAPVQVPAKATKISGTPVKPAFWRNAVHLSLEARRELFGGAQIERRPRGASRAALAPTFVSGQ